MEELKYTLDQFADIKILRYLIPEFDKLSLKEKNYVYYLNEAAKWGRDITWMQLGKHNVILRTTLENIIETYKGTKGEEFEQFLVYAKRVFFSTGFHHHYNKHKFYPECSKEYFKTLLDNSDSNNFELKDKQFSEFKEFIIDLIYSEETKTGDILLDDYTDFYENITALEAKHFYNEQTDLKEKEPVSFGLNSKLIKKDNKIEEITYSENGLYGEYIKQITYYLNKALTFTQNKQQEKYTKLLIEYFKTGDLNKWDEYNIAWVQDNDSNIDYINGFIEVYDDPISYKGTYEALVNMKDIEATKVTELIASNAEWFEKNSPIDPSFKKEKINGIKAKAIHALNLSGGCYPSPPIGINLPNSDWIREKYGSKSVTITNLIKAYAKASRELPSTKKGEFVYSKEEMEFNEKYIDEADDLHTHLHECLGHGSGKLLDGVSPNALKEYHSALEEARADIFSLYYMADQHTVDLGIVSSLEVAKAYYNIYIRNGLQVQLTRIELGKDIVEAHMVARQLISNWAYEKCKDSKIIEKLTKEDKTYFVINDFLKLREVFKEILIELQRIKSTGDYEVGKELVNKYGVKIDHDLHKETLERYKKLGLKPYSGFVNPEIVPVLENNVVIDYKVLYPDNFVEQNIGYSKNYSIE